MTKEEFCRLYAAYDGEPMSNLAQLVQHTFTGQELYEFCEYLLKNASPWIEYDFNKPETRPTEYGKYFVCRKDGKVHLETWNGSGWAYNEKVITHWQKVNPPKQSAS